MRSAYIRIKGGQLLDTYRAWGFLVLDNGDDKQRISPPEKKRDKTSYAGEGGAHEDPRTVYDEFDYKMRFIVEARNKDFVSVNSKIRAWNDAVRERTAGSDVVRCKTITLYDNLMRCKIVGTPELIAEIDKNGFYRDSSGKAMDCAVIELTVHVSDPGECRFDMAQSVQQEFTVRDLQPGWYNTAGEDIYFVNDPYLRHIIIPCKAGTTVTYKMRTYGSAVDWIVRDPATGLCTGDYQSDPAHTGMNNPASMTFEADRDFIINHDSQRVNDFCLYVDNSGAPGFETLPVASGGGWIAAGDSGRSYGTSRETGMTSERLSQEPDSNEQE